MYIAMDDRGYVCASDVEDDLAVHTNITDEPVDDDDDVQVFGSEHTAEYNNKTYVVQWVLSAGMDNSD
jgi:hypothetical protein